VARIAVVLFNLGGPDQLSSVEPFLFNLFNDPAIITLPNPFRYLLAKWISKKRGPVAREIYKLLGGRSPLLDQTKDQATALEDMLNSREDEYQVFITMRYWHPRAEEVVKAVKFYGPDEVVLLPLYPQFSTTTTGSSVNEWQHQARKQGLDVLTSTICCYPENTGFAKAYADLITGKLEEIEGKLPKLLFSAHGLPEKLVEAGDPYPQQVTRSVTAILTALDRDDLASQICYQSRVGPMKWIGPDIEDEIKHAGADNLPVMIIPVAFVSEHSETLVELDIEYAKLAKECGIPEYSRVSTVTTHPDFIGGLAELVEHRQKGKISGNCGHTRGYTHCFKA